MYRCTYRREEIDRIILEKKKKNCTEYRVFDDFSKRNTFAGRV